MGTLIVTEFMTLDGVAQAPGRPEEDREGGFEHGGWQAPLMHPESGAAIFERAARMDALLLGRRTYDIFAEYWPTAPDEIPFTGLFARVPKYVASQTLVDPPAWEGTTRVPDASTDAITELKDRYDELHVIGSLGLVQTLLRLDLVDRFHLWVFPVLLGAGKRVFAEGTVPRALRLVESTTHPTGALQLVYENAGAPTFGDMTE